ncbi:G1 family glutamic endopeptidase [Bosea sp. BIWAKO-01]|uniref:G1 family glutamic endopeptidase n=1 Tax=Bosea sp. BIWAKO-01 TaxID=506668 RepID=UPI00085352D7|nr:G1 family glutamic endopeptidase [Bosea sp. BIWAKO-01]
MDYEIRPVTLQGAFDPLNATDEFINEYGLPKRPPPGPALDVWNSALNGVTFLSGQVLDLEIVRQLRLTNVSRGNQGTQESSRNWSGAYVRSEPGKRIRMVQAVWKVPAPPPISYPPRPWSMWVGLDGHDPASRLMPQIGVAAYQIPTPGAPVLLLVSWWQWWDRFDLARLHNPISFVGEGHTVFAQITRTGDDIAQFLLTNLDTGEAFCEEIRAPSTMEDGTPRPRPPRIEGRTAECIVELPLLPKPYVPRDIILGNYQSTTFKNFFAFDGAPVEEARAMRMNLWNYRPQPGILVSRATIDRTRNEIGMTYVGPP